jgi:KDO2-lipid IV(A) lauroyltransferase
MAEQQRKKRPLLRRYRRRFRVLCFYVILFFVRGLREFPRPVAIHIGYLFGWLFYMTGGKYRTTTEKHIKASFPDMDAAARRRLVRGVFLNVSRVFVEYILYAHNPDRYSQRFIDSADAEKKVKKILGEGRGVIMITAHFGPWELLGSVVSRRLGTTIIVQKLGLKELYTLVENWRRRLGFIMVDNTESMKIFRTLRKGGSLGILPDLYMPKMAGTYIEFFGRETYITLGPSVLHLATGAPIVPMFIERSGSGYYIKAGEPIEFTRTGDNEKDIPALTSLWLAELEKQIRKYPEQWVWFGDRWGMQPKKETGGGKP